MTALLFTLPVATKNCRTCGEAKTLDRFYAAKSNRDGLNTQCKACFGAACKARYEANPEPARARSRAFEAANPEIARARKSAAYQANREEWSARNKAWREANPERKRTIDREWSERNRERKAAVNKAWRAENLDTTRSKKREYILRTKYGIGTVQYEELLRLQGGGCAICGSRRPGGPKNRSFAVDHHHATGAVRGLLCFHCNTAIGHLREDPELLQRAIEYLDDTPLFAGAANDQTDKAETG